MDEALFGRVARELSVAIALAALVEVSFFAALIASFGAFSGGTPTTTPVTAQIYFVVGLAVTPFLIGRTWQMRTAARTQDLERLRNLHVNRWKWIAVLFSGVLPAFSLQAVAVMLPPESVDA